MPEPEISAILRDLIEAVHQSPEAWASTLEKRKAQLTTPIAEEARSLAGEAAQTGQLGIGLILYGIAAAVYMAVGNSLEHLRCRYYMFSLRFLEAKTLQEYLSLKSEYFALAAKAQDIGAADVRFQSLYSAADCLFFAREATEDPVVSNALLLDGLMVLTALIKQAAPSVAGPVHFDRFVSLLSATVTNAMNASWVGLDRAKAEALLRSLASDLESRISTDYQIPDNPEKSVSTARTLASLSISYGSSTAADARLEAAAKVLGVTHRNVELWLSLMGDRYGAARRLAATPEDLARARQVMEREVEKRRQRFRSRAGRLWAAQMIDRSLSAAVGDAIRQGGDTPAHVFETVDSLKARMLLDQMMRLETFPSAALKVELVEREREILRFNPDEDQDEQIAELRLLSLLSVGLPWDAGDRLDRLDGVEALYAGVDAGFHGTVPGASLTEVQAALSPDEGLLEYFIPTHRTHPAKELFAIGITSSEIEVVPISLDGLPETPLTGTVAIDGQQPFAGSPLGEAVWSLRSAIREADDVRANQWLDLLWRLLILPVLNTWQYPDESKRWIIVPHGPLHYVPFAALQQPGEGGPRLVEEVAITVCPSASVWLALRRAARPRAASFLGVADPLLLKSNLDPLKDAKKELSNAIKSLPGFEHTALPADLATEDAVRKRAPGKSIVHFATHGEFPESDPFDYHRILLAESKNNDGRLHAEELRDMDLRAARLVVLSICDGGLYRFGPGDEPLGLIPALFIAGAENVLAPLWRIEDRASRRLTSAFYRGLLKYGPAEALRRANIDAIKKGTPLRDWAGFVNAGCGRPLDDTASRKSRGRPTRKRASSGTPRSRAV